MSSEPTKPAKPTGHDHQQTQLQEDEAFIDALYQQLPADKDQQPSDFLDKRIIKAAYQAVATEPTKINKRKITWFHFLATAASLTLVISLVVQQQSHILPPVDTSADLVSSSQKNKQSSDDEMIVEAVEEFSVTKPMMENTSTNDSYAATQYDQQMAITQPVMINSIAPKSISARQSMTTQQSALASPLAPTALTSIVTVVKNQPRKLEKKSYQSTAKIQQINQQAFAMTKRSSPVNAATVQKLTLAQYRIYREQDAQLSAENKLRWSLISEQTDSYYITIYLSDNNTASYRLAKTDFRLNTLPVKTHDKQTPNKQDFSEIILKNE